jgi:hypothetical protein
VTGLRGDQVVLEIGSQYICAVIKSLARAF